MPASFVTPPALLYATLTAAACSLSLLPLLLSTTLGFSGRQIGSLLALTPIVALLGNPTLTNLADRSRSHRTYLQVTVALAAVLTVGVLARPTFGWMVVGTVVVSALRNPAFPVLDALALAALDEDGKDEGKDGYGRIRLWGSVACGVATAAVGLIVDRFHDLNLIVYSHVAFLVLFCLALTRFPIDSVGHGPLDLEVHNHHHHHHHHRLSEEEDDFEFSPLSTFVREEDDHPRVVHSTDDVSPSFIMCKGKDDDRDEDGTEQDDADGNVTVVDTESNGDGRWEEEEDVFAGWQPLSSDDDHHHPLPSSSPSPASPVPTPIAPYVRIGSELGKGRRRSCLGLRLGFPDVTVVLFALAVFVMGATVSIVDYYLYLYLAEKMDATPTFLGIAKPVQVGMEVPFFYFSKQILERMGVTNMLALAQGILVVRLMGYGLLEWGDSVWWALPSEALHGVFYGIMWAAAVRFADSTASLHHRATAQGLLSGLYAGLAPAVGAYLGGAWWDRTQGDMVSLFGLLAGVNAA
ncbi:hypothetical protein HKX48_004648, partial [Thoreauomyces humboldtii]